MPDSRPIAYVYGFEADDIRQERDLGQFMARRLHPDKPLRIRDRGRIRVGRHREKEASYRELKSSLRFHIPVVDTWSADQAFQAALLHEILDLLPYSQKEDALKALALDDGRVYRRIGRKIREMLPGIVQQEP